MLALLSFAVPMILRESILRQPEPEVDLPTGLYCKFLKYLYLAQEAVPEMEEMSLLTDAIKQLDELFLVVVVGEFNSGKSSIINALLGNKYLAEGILPTTNEISVLKFRSAPPLHRLFLIGLIERRPSEGSISLRHWSNKISEWPVR